MRLPSARTTLLPPVPPLDRAAVRLFLLSAALLFTELLLIRWIPANVFYVGYFTNFILVASFLGIGLGILVGRRARPLPYAPFAPLLFLVVLLVRAARFDLKVRSTNELFFGLNESSAGADTNFLVLPLLIVLVAAVMAALALPLGGLLRSLQPLRAYAFDVAGAIAGVALFAALSLAGTPPGAWFATLGALLLLLALGSGLTAWSAAGAACVASVIFNGALLPPGERWSPYYRIDLAVDPAGPEAVLVNGIPHQKLFTLDEAAREPFYDQVYRWFPGRRFERVLVVGAGTGTDVAVALARGAGRVDAVEIDPAILDIGVERHPGRPYDDARVRRHVADGRAFLRATDERYDLVVFALPDSLTLVSSTANLRLESFLFTREAFADVRKHLAPNGLFVLYNYYRQPWLVEKLAAMLEDVFGGPPLVRTYSELPASAAVLAAGPLAAAAAPPGDRSERLDLVGAPATATDDWPFLYLRQPFIAPHYLATLGFLLLLAVVALAGAVGPSGPRRLSPHFFALGAAFLLLETRTVSTFGLLFGNTWWVNALVFAAILVSVLLAILVTMRVRLERPTLLYLGLFGSLALGYLVPAASLLFEPAWLRYVAASVLAFAPVFFANLVFSYSFRDSRAADLAFASNLFGAVVGGALEYASLLVGLQNLLVLAAGLYGLAFLLARRWRVLGDTALELAPASPAS